MPETCFVTCGHCSDTFPFDNYHSMVLCPHCRKRSSIGSKYARNRGILYLLAGILLLCIGIGLATGILNEPTVPGGIIAAYLSVFGVALAYFSCACYYLRFKVSILSSVETV